MSSLSPRTAVIIITCIAITAITAFSVNTLLDDLFSKRKIAQHETINISPRLGIAQTHTPVTDKRISTFVVHDTPHNIKKVSFTDANNADKTLADWHGKPVLVNLWATWCGPCRHEMPALDRLQNKLGSDGFSVLAISLDRGGLDKPRGFFEEIGIKHLRLYNDKTSKIGSDLAIIGMPTTLLINAEGKEIGRLSGPAEWDSDEAIELITRLSRLKS